VLLCCQVEALTNTLSQMQATNVAFSASLRAAETDISPEQQKALRCGRRQLQLMGRPSYLPA
jgi:hypothetical protein